ncbi:unnamed protein product [Adineta steineri]|uniref:SH3 domain-containing protein n=1 Tax=Adineta steineri TaxID=433720 RepID=A0A819QZ32_9BILA|nr:unnamed protein product [Adineta steineri]CAF0976816.1 unnamed protein product [Adineta steineri]CAF1033122.1 unnamed protein product [Adineta steineri]CAF1155157.1 unnamed protein product [Adineta steineri]CAF1328608.1 unnamed protein product [Adineta steineri]
MDRFIIVSLMLLILGSTLCEGGEAMCGQMTAAHTCASMDCEPYMYVRADQYYPCDCFEIEKLPHKTKKWYHIETSKGKYGYVRDEHCWAEVPKCKK